MSAAQITASDERDNQDNQNLWCDVEDGTDAYIIERRDGTFDVVDRLDSRQPNRWAGFDSVYDRSEDDILGGPYATLDGAKVAYLLLRAPRVR